MQGDQKMGESRAAVAMAMDGIRHAIAMWRAAPDAEKGNKARDVLAHVGAHPGLKLESVTDAATAAQLRADFKKRSK